MATTIQIGSNGLAKALAAVWFAGMAMLLVVVPFLTGSPEQRWLLGNLILTAILALGAAWIWAVARSGFRWLERQRDAVSPAQRRREHKVALGVAVVATYGFAVLSPVDVSLISRVVVAVWESLWLALPLGMPAYFLIRLFIRHVMVLTR